MTVNKELGGKKPSHIIANACLMPDMIAGGVAGNHTLTGIRVADRIIKVVSMTFTLTEGVPNVPLLFILEDLTAEFRVAAGGITADDTISNPGGTSTAAKLLFVWWEDVDRLDQAEGFYPG